MDKHTAQRIPYDLRQRLIEKAGGPASAVDEAMLAGPDEDGFYYLLPPRDGDAWAWTQTPDDAASWTVAA